MQFIAVHNIIFPNKVLLPDYSTSNANSKLSGLGWVPMKVCTVLLGPESKTEFVGDQGFPIWPHFAP